MAQQVRLTRAWCSWWSGRVVAFLSAQSIEREGKPGRPAKLYAWRYVLPECGRIDGVGAAAWVAALGDEAARQPRELYAVTLRQGAAGSVERQVRHAGERGHSPS